MERPDFFELKNGSKLKLPFSHTEYQNRLNKLISNKQVNQLKRYNKLFNNWIKSTGEEPVFLNKADIEGNINRLIQYYKNNGYFDVKVEIDSIINTNKAEVLYKIDTDSIYTIDSITYNILPKEIDSLLFLI